MQKYEREIEELLESLERRDDARPRTIRRDRPPQLPRRRRSSFGSSVRQIWGALMLSPSQLMATGIGLVVASWILGVFLPSSITQVLAVLGVVLFLLAIVSGLFGQRRTGRQEKLWRGRSVEPDDTSWTEFKHRLEDSARDFRRRFSRRRY